MLTELLKEVNHFLFSRNRKIGLPITISIQPNKGEAVRRLETGKFLTSEIIPTIKTTTQTIGKDEISFVVPNIRFNNANLAGEGKVLYLEIELPNGKVNLEAIGEHYERIGKRTSIANYLIAAKIIYINPLDEEIFRNYLKNGERVEKSNSESLVFGITER
jgi:hypothetical protein